MLRKVLIETLQPAAGDTVSAETLWKDIAKRYASANRYYHNLQHLDHITTELQPLEKELEDWPAMVCAIAYHDIIYNTLRHDNEEKSAAYASEALMGILQPQQLEHCRQMIIATKSHALHPDPDINYFTDADLSILGAAAQEYTLYTQNIRREYRFYPDLVYRSGRKKVLQHFLQMDRIFKTDYFYNKYEVNARSNLEQEYAGK